MRAPSSASRDTARDTTRGTTPDSELNMTPMIDIVFQLILFFLLNLRFKTIDFRIETALPGVGADPTPELTPPEPRLVVAMTRRSPEDPGRAATRVTVGSRTWTLPSVHAARPVRDAAFAEVTAEIGRLRADASAPLDLKGEISTPLPFGGVVPHGDVVGVVDAFLAAGVRDVRLSGAPLPRR